MKISTIFLALLAVLGAAIQTFAQCKLDLSGYQVVFEDNFDTYSTASQLGTKWLYQPNPQKPFLGFGTEYFDESQFSFLPGGILRITAERVPMFAPTPTDPSYDPTKPERKVNFKSGKIESKVLVEGFGAFEMRCKLPVNDGGIWPAFWFYSGATEVDVFDTRNNNPSRSLYSDVHNWRNGNRTCGSTAYKTGAGLDSEFNVYTVVWNSEKVTFFLNGREWRTLLASQVGGLYNDLGRVIADLQMDEWATVNEAHMDIDYIKIYRPKIYISGTNNYDYSTPFKSSNEWINHSINASNGNLTSVSPQTGSIAVNPNNPDEVVFIGKDGSIYFDAKDSYNQWHEENLLSGNRGLIPGNITFNGYYGIVPYRGENGRLQFFGRYQGWYHADIDVDSSPTNYQINSAPNSIVSAPNGDVFYIGVDNKIQRFSHTNSTWIHSWVPYTYGDPGLGYPNADYIRGDIVMVGDNIFYKGFDGRLQAFYLSNGTYYHVWIDTNFSSNAPDAVSSKPGSITSNNSNGVFYIGVDNKVHSYLYYNNGWQHSILPYSYGTTAFGYSNADYANAGIGWDNTNNRVIYAGNDGRIQYFAASNGSWSHGWVDDYANTTEFTTFYDYETANSTNYYPGPSLSIGSNGNIYYSDRMNTLRYFKYEPCEYVPACSSTTSVHRSIAMQPLATTNASSSQLATELMLYPNPTHSTITVELPVLVTPSTPGHWVLYTGLGQPAMSGAILDKKFTVDLSALPQGIYLLETLIGAERSTKKIVKE